MYLFLLPLLLGFTFNSASTFTTFYSHRLGERPGRLVSALLRDVLGIPVWALGYGMAIAADSAPLFQTGWLTSTIAWLFILMGVSVIVVGLLSIRWRAAAPSVQDTLVNQGIYAHIRHPLYSGMLLELAGLFLWVPRWSVLMACSLGWVWMLVQSRLEEMDLVKRLPAYQEYMQQVPRFLPTLNLRRSGKM